MQERSRELTAGSKFANHRGKGRQEQDVMTAAALGCCIWETNGMTLTSNLEINGERLWDSLMEMAKIGPG
ncbi:MAG: hypothetical protein KDH19_07290, partial [Geminicoccaceae bacterium]|nr:hypothetical protein [Geminicoccaceae bacterium]